MGASTFVTFAKGRDAASAFYNAVEQALYDYGHAGYTGTIAEKDSFCLLETVQSQKAAQDLANKLLDEDDERISNKWGPAGCIPIKGTNTYCFVGWASD